MNRIRRFVVPSLCLCAAIAPGLAEPQIEYEVTFDATWTAQTHPVDFPPDAHFSWPVGTVHTDQAVFWEPGALASPGIERMAETGQYDVISTEIAAVAQQGHASSDVILGEVIFSPDSTSTIFVATPSFPQVTLVLMIAPSPDWFAGTRGLELFADGRWRDEYVFDLHGYDAGTDSGATYTSFNAATVPPQPIARLDTAPYAPDGVNVPIGTFTFRIVGVDGRAPYGDEDGDGLTNLREAELGTDPLLSDTDGDSLSDALDNCRLVANAAQADADADGFGDACDNCVSTANVGQRDTDGDAEGDRCDLDDGLVRFVSIVGDAEAWQDEVVFDGYDRYRGDLALLRSAGDYTQDPASPAADRACGLTQPAYIDAHVPGPGEGRFTLIAGTVGAGSGSLGIDGSGTERPNTRPCP